MPTGQEDRVKLLTKIGLPALIEAVKAVPVVGPLIAAGFAGASAYLEEKLAGRDVPEQARQVLLDLAEDYRRMLEAEGDGLDEGTFEKELKATLALITETGLSGDDLVTKAKLDADRAANLTLERAAARLEGLDERAEERTQRLVREYYRVLLSRKDALDDLGVAALRTMLALLSEFENKLPSKTADEIEKRRREAALRKLSWPERVEPTKLDLSILKAQARLVPFIGGERVKVRDDLVHWAERLRGGSMVGVRIYTGAGGSGKTRLAIEASERLRERGWRTGFVPSDLNDGEIEAILSNPEPMFLVVDYAGSKSGLVKRILKAAARARADRKHPLSFVLLDRAYTAELKGILEDMTDPDAVGWAEFVSDCVRREPIQLPEIGEADRAAIFDEAYRKFREISAPEPEEDVRYGEDQVPERPLAMILLALLASQGHRVVKSKEEESVFWDAWNWERGKWKLRLTGKMPREFDKEALDLIESAMIARTLGRSFESVDELRVFWEAHFPPEASTLTGDELKKKGLALQIPDIFSPAYDSIVPPIVPDPLADSVTFRFCVENQQIEEYFKNAFPQGYSTARAALVLHRILVSAENSRPEERTIIAELCRWVDRRLKPKEAADIVRYISGGNFSESQQSLIINDFWGALTKETRTYLASLETSSILLTSNIDAPVSRSKK